MLLKTTVEHVLGIKSKVIIVLDFILALIVINTGDVKLILYYFSVLILVIIFELIIYQMIVLSEMDLTPQNIEKLANQNFELKSNIKISI